MRPVAAHRVDRRGSPPPFRTACRTSCDWRRFGAAGWWIPRSGQEVAMKTNAIITPIRYLTSSSTRPRERTEKLQVLLLMGSGVVAAAQIGKAIIAVPIIRSDLALGLDFAELVVATFATLGAITGIGAGLVVSGLGARQSLIGGVGV